MPESNMTETLPGGPTFEMIKVEGGRYIRGGETNSHQVELDGFHMGKNPVTQALWKAVMGVENDPAHFKGDDRPVESISWHDTQEFLQKLNKITGKPYRLPTEAEWEYAACGGNQSEGYQYAGGNKLEEIAWYRENSYGETKSVGMKDPNELGLYDMSGQVWEWCQDWYDRNYYSQCQKKGKVVNPLGPESGTYRVQRGGGWLGPAEVCRVTARGAVDLTDRGDDIGFRLALSLQ